MAEARNGERFLLVGSPRIVAETAALLERNNVQFLILDRTPEQYHAHVISSLVNPLDSPDEEPSYNEQLAPFKDRLIGSLDDLSATDLPTAVFDVSYVPAELRQVLLEEVAERVPNLIVLSSTLTCTATELASTLSITAQVIGFNGMPGWTSLGRIELAPSLRSSERSINRARRVFERLGMETELVEDRVGLVTPRVLAMLINEAAFAVMERVALPGDVDRAVTLGVNYPHGLLEWADMLGLDCVLSILDALYEEYREPRYRACVLLRQYVRAGMLGRATGRGFFEYTPTN
jgi:3-hydroxybutyryl-CoA dehydrogenase